MDRDSIGYIIVFHLIQESHQICIYTGVIPALAQGLAKADLQSEGIGVDSEDQGQAEQTAPSWSRRIVLSGPFLSPRASDIHQVILLSPQSAQLNKNQQGQPGDRGYPECTLSQALLGAASSRVSRLGGQFLLATARKNSRDSIAQPCCCPDEQMAGWKQR